MIWSKAPKMEAVMDAITLADTRGVDSDSILEQVAHYTQQSVADAFAATYVTLRAMT